jgi:hypothetical protein
MLRQVTFILAALLLSTTSILSADDEVKKKLDTARTAYKSELEKFRSAVNEWFDKRMDEARKDGNKKAVDQIKLERERFSTKGDLPQQTPGSLSSMPKTARTRLESAFEAAIKEYTKAALDKQAAAIEAELAEFKKPDLSQNLVKIQDEERKYWKHNHGYFMKGEGKDWFEKWDDGKKPPNLFTETRRTTEFIELRNTQIPVICRLYKDRAAFKDEKNGDEFKTSYYGGWKALPK